VVTLLTDFGWQDPYVAEVKGVLLQTFERLGGGEPWPRVVDLCHTLPPCDVRAAAWFLARVHPNFPPGTVHLAVVDPGVGTSRPVVAVQAARCHFVGPGNGLFRFLVGTADLTVVRLNAATSWRGEGFPPAPTFHGRDVMAPVAARLALGCPIRELGAPGTAADLGSLEAWPAAVESEAVGSSRPIGRIVWIDRFGNAITDIDRASGLGDRLSAGAVLRLAGTEVPGPVLTFAEATGSEPFWYWGSGGKLEVAVDRDSVARRFGWRVGLAVGWTAP
jgi:S-adenosylmethionine hydrolase